MMKCQAAEILSFWQSNQYDTKLVSSALIVRKLAHCQTMNLLNDLMPYDPICFIPTDDFDHLFPRCFWVVFMSLLCSHETYGSFLLNCTGTFNAFNTTSFFGRKRLFDRIKVTRSLRHAFNLLFAVMFQHANCVESHWRNWTWITALQVFLLDWVESFIVEFAVYFQKWWKSCLLIKIKS